MKTENIFQSVNHSPAVSCPYPLLPSVHTEYTMYFPLSIICDKFLSLPGLVFASLTSPIEHLYGKSLPTIQGETQCHLFSKYHLPPTPQSHPCTLTYPTWAGYSFRSVPLAFGAELSFPMEHCGYLVLWRTAESVGHMWDLDLYC